MIIYIAHPVGDGPDRPANLLRARRWFGWLLEEYPRDALVMPWLLYCEELDETPSARRRGLRDDLLVLETCDAIALVGGRLSPGMEQERNVALVEGMQVLDLLHLGPEPPADACDACHGSGERLSHGYGASVGWRCDACQGTGWEASR